MLSISSDNTDRFEFIGETEKNNGSKGWPYDHTIDHDYDGVQGGRGEDTVFFGPRVDNDAHGLPENEAELDPALFEGAHGAGEVYGAHGHDKLWGGSDATSDESAHGLPSYTAEIDPQYWPNSDDFEPAPQNFGAPEADWPFEIM